MQDQSIVSWNVAGLAGLLRKAPHSVRQLVEGFDADVICLQETKLTDAKSESILQSISHTRVAREMEQFWRTQRILWRDDPEQGKAATG